MRTNWTGMNITRCIDWSADEHAAVAAELLDSNCVPTLCEDPSEDGKEPGHRHYSIQDDDARKGDEPDYAPYIAALVHSQLALYKQKEEA